MTVEENGVDAAGYWNIDVIAAELRQVRAEWRAAHWRNAEHGAIGFPSRLKLDKIMDALCGALFPLRLGPSFVRAHNEDGFVEQTLQTALSRLYSQIRLELAYRAGSSSEQFVDQTAATIIRQFAHALPDLRRLLDTDVAAAYAGDPAARSVDEVLLCYPGALAIIHHRLAHAYTGSGRRWWRGSSPTSRIRRRGSTSIRAHGSCSGFFIDHGSGVVIGETAVIGSRVRIYQAVTLGARSFPAEEDGSLSKGVPRHPSV